MQRYPAVVLCTFAVLLCAWAQDDEAFDDLLCTKDEKLKASVVKCVSLLPKSHLEMIRKCDPQLEPFGEDTGKILDFYCSNQEELVKVDKCVSDAYMKKGVSIMEPIQPTVECMQKLADIRE